jgi:galactofuranose transport system permease protein
LRQAVIGRLRASVAQSRGFGVSIDCLIQGLIQTYITFRGTISSWWTGIVVGILHFLSVFLQCALTLTGHRESRACQVAPQW